MAPAGNHQSTFVGGSHHGGASFEPLSDRDGDSDDEKNFHQSLSAPKIAEYDASVLKEEEEVETLLAKKRPFTGLKKVFRRSSGSAETDLQDPEAKGQRLIERRASQSRNVQSDEGESDFEDGRSRSSSLDSAIRDAFHHGQIKSKAWSGTVAVGVGTAVVLLLTSIFCLHYWRFPPKSLTETMSNGTHIFKPSTIIISLDGFRADFANRNLTHALNSLVSSGVSPQYMLPSFPSVTFPNHFTLVTGLYPENHGVVGNSFYDPQLGEEFYYTDPLRSMQPKWWNAEPIWVTAENQGIRTAVHMWPGSEAHIASVEPTYLDKFNDTEALTTKTARILELLDFPGDFDAPNNFATLRPQLIAAYVPNVDSDGHKYGPNSTEIRTTISEVDEMLAIIVEGLKERNLTEIVNLVIVSDHGMATTSTNRLIQLNDLIDMSLIDHIDGWPLQGLRPRNSSRDVPLLHDQLLKEAEKTEGFDVYDLNTMPERYHFVNNQRIAPLWIVPRTGWAIVERTDFDVKEAKAAGTAYHPIGLHGYDHQHPLMRAIFVARGPAFPHAPNSRVSVFQNIEVYNIVCDSLGIEPQPNNGTLRLPLKTTGLHDDSGATLETPSDPPEEASPMNEIESGQGSPADAQALSQSHTEPDGPDKDNWMDVLREKLNKFTEWIHRVSDNLINHDKDG